MYQTPAQAPATHISWVTTSYRSGSLACTVADKDFAKNWGRVSFMASARLLRAVTPRLTHSMLWPYMTPVLGSLGVGKTAQWVRRAQSASVEQFCTTRGVAPVGGMVQPSGTYPSYTPPVTPNACGTLCTSQKPVLASADMPTTPFVCPYLELLGPAEVGRGQRCRQGWDDIVAMRTQRIPAIEKHSGASTREHEDAV